MYLLLNHPSKLFFRKPVFVRSHPRLSKGVSYSLSPPCSIIGVEPCGENLGTLVIRDATDSNFYTHVEKKVPLELVDSDPMVTIGSSHGWVATLKDDGTVILQDDLIPVPSDKYPKRISLPPLVTLPHCQIKVVTNVAMSSSPEEKDCIVAIKFLGPQMSFCRPAQRNAKWINVRIENPCFFSSPVMFSKKHNMFRILGSGGHLIGSWDLHKHKKNPKLRSLRDQRFPQPTKAQVELGYDPFPKLTKAKRDLLDSCYTTEYLVESNCQTFVVKRYRKAVKIIKGIAKMKTECLMVFMINEQGSDFITHFTYHIGDRCMFLSKSEPFCVSASSFPGMFPNTVEILDVDESAFVLLHLNTNISSVIKRDQFRAPYHIPPQQNINLVAGNSV